MMIFLNELDESINLHGGVVAVDAVATAAVVAVVVVPSLCSDRRARCTWTGRIPRQSIWPRKSCSASRTDASNEPNKRLTLQRTASLIVPSTGKTKICPAYSTTRNNKNTHTLGKISKLIFIDSGEGVLNTPSGASMERS